MQAGQSGLGNSKLREICATRLGAKFNKRYPKDCKLDRKPTKNRNHFFTLNCSICSTAIRDRSVSKRMGGAVIAESILSKECFLKNSIAFPYWLPVLNSSLAQIKINSYLHLLNQNVRCDVCHSSALISNVSVICAAECDSTDSIWLCYIPDGRRNFYALLCLLRKCSERMIILCKWTFDLRRVEWQMKDSNSPCPPSAKIPGQIHQMIHSFPFVHMNHVSTKTMEILAFVPRSAGSQTQLFPCGHAKRSTRIGWANV